MRRELEFVKKLVHCLSDVELRLVGNSEEEVEAFIREMTQAEGDFAEANEAFCRRFMAIRPGCLYEVQSAFELQFAVIRDRRDKSFLIIGPCLIEAHSSNRLRSIAGQYGFDQHTARRIERYCASLPEMSYERFHELGTLVAARYMGVPEPVPYERIEQKNDLELRQRLAQTENYEELSKMRRIERRYEYSAAMTEAVKEGNLTLAYSFLRQMRPETNEIVRNSNPLRNAQNMCIVANTQLRHALEENGIHPYTLDKVSGEIGMHIERLRTQKDAAAFSLEIIRRYCELAQEPKVAHLKPFSRLAVTYIKAHLSDNLTVKSTAEALAVNPNYLSSQFHREVGTTFTEYVNRERTRQAASLLLHTNLSVQHIASSVGYNNTSYFARQFARSWGVSPSVYRGQRD